MPSRSLNQIKNSINSYEYDDELLIVIDFGTVLDEQLTADVIDDTLIVSHQQQNGSDQDIEFSLPAQFTEPEVVINNGIITISQSLVQDEPVDIPDAEPSNDDPDEVDLDETTEDKDNTTDSSENDSDVSSDES